MHCSERRRYIRHETAIAVTLHKKGEQLPATMIDIGKGGIDLISEAFIHPGTELDITANYSNDYVIHGTVRWAHLDSIKGRDQFRFGTEADRMLVPENILQAWFSAERQACNPGGSTFIPKKPTYGELEHKIETLIKEAVQRARLESVMRQLNERLEQQVVEQSALAESRTKQLRALASELTLSEQRERCRMAEFLHDHLQQLLIAAKFNCEALCADLDPEQRQAAEKIIDCITRSMQVSRSMTAEFAPPGLRQGRFCEALKWLAGSMRQDHGLTVELKTAPGIDAEREDIAVFLFQSVRELLLNVIKHAGVKSARVEVARDAKNRLCASVSDAGVGFDQDTLREKAQTGTGFGLLRIRERLALLGGTLEIESAPGNGASFTLVCPSAEKG